MVSTSQDDVSAQTTSTSQAQFSVAFSAQSPESSLSSNEGKTGPCGWCKAPSHDSDRCWSKDPANLKLYPSPSWFGGIPPRYILEKYCEKMTSAVATRLCCVANRIMQKTSSFLCSLSPNPSSTSPVLQTPSPPNPISSKPHLLQTPISSSLPNPHHHLESTCSACQNE
jgi:hypothetical protein